MPNTENIENINPADLTPTPGPTPRHTRRRANTPAETVGEGQTTPSTPALVPEPDYKKRARFLEAQIKEMAQTLKTEQDARLAVLRENETLRKQLQTISTFHAASMSLLCDGLDNLKSTARLVSLKKED